MQDRNKWAFWGFVLAAAVLVCVPSTLMLDGYRRYRRLAEGVDPAALRPRRVRFVAHSGRPAADAPDLDFVEFKAREPKAKDVELIGDFNNWTPGTLKLAKHGESWELMMPLPKGRYRYVFLVDGKRRLDASAPETERVAGEAASVKIVP